MSLTTTTDKLTLTNSNKYVELVREAKTGTKTQDCSTQQLSVMLIFVYELIGLKKANYPDKTSSMVLFNTLQRDQGNLYITEIKIGFELYVAGKLDVDTKHYQSIDSIFLNTVLNAYKKYKQTDINKHLIEQSEDKQPTEEEKHSRISMAIIEHFEYFKEKKEMKEYQCWQFEVLEKQGILTLSDERKIEIGASCKEPYKKLLEQRREAASKRNDKEEIKSIIEKLMQPQKDNGFRNFCQEQALKNYFTELIEMDAHIKDFI